MTTNITPTQALEKIKEITSKNYTISCIPEIWGICDQALIPQECDVASNKITTEESMRTCKFYLHKNGGHWCKKYDLPCLYRLNHLMCDYWHKKWAELRIEYMNKTNLELNIKIARLEQQLHSQEKTFFKTDERAIGVEDRDYIKGEKTFTVEEVYQVVNKVLNAYGEHELFYTDFVKCYMPEFEKAVG